MYKYLIILFLVALLSCQHLRNEAITEVLTKGVYWDIMTTKHMATYCYKVERNGDCHYYYYSRLSGCRTLYDSEDQVFDTTWYVDAGRDLLRLQGLEGRILSFNRDTILLLNEYDGTKTLLVRSKRTD